MAVDYFSEGVSPQKLCQLYLTHTYLEKTGRAT